MASNPTSGGGGSTSPVFKVIGEPNFYDATANALGRYVAANTLNYASDISCGGGFCYVVDYYSSRILVFAGAPSSGNVPIAALGQPDLTSSLFNRGQSYSSASTLNYPGSVLVSGSKLIVYDEGNGRVLIWNSLPIVSGAPADVVVGQSDFVSNQYNQGLAAPTAATLSWGYGLAVSGGKLIVSDSGNNRVLVYGSIPTANGASASLVIGQSDFVSDGVNQGGATAANTLSSPNGVRVAASGQLLISDGGNNRVLIYQSFPSASGTGADYEIGQADLTSGSANRGGASPTAATLNFPGSVLDNGGALYVVDSNNNRVLYYSSIPTSNGASATAVLGQSSATAAASCPSSANASCMGYPFGLTISGGKLYVADGSDNRILVYNAAPTSNVPANDVYGQGDFSTISANRASVPNPYGFSWSGYVAELLDRWLLINDRDNNRITIWDKNNLAAGAQYVVGQPDLHSNSANRGGSVDASGLSYPHAVAASSSQFFVADSGNNRVLVYDATNLSLGESASFVVGQVSPTGNLGNQGGAAGPNTISSPYGIDVYLNQLFVLDSGNCRVLVYNLPITSNAPTPVKVIGQPDYTTTACPVDQQHPNNNSGIHVDANFMVTMGGDRALFFTQPLGSGLINASGVMGESSYTASVSAATEGDDNFGGGAESSAVYAGGYYLLTDKNNGRVLAFSGVPTPGVGMVADFVLGQADFVSSNYTPGLPDGSGPLDFDGVTGLAVDQDNLYVAEAWGDRVDVIPLALLPTLLHH